MTKILTCYLKDVDTFNGRFKWLWTHKSTLRKKKEEFLENLRTHFKQQQSAIHKEFPKKRMEMLDHVIYNLVATGIQAIRSETLMKKFNVSKSTVSRFVRSLKATPFVLVARYIKEDTTGTHPDSYVFILKNHKNFNKICDEIFFAHDTTEVQNVQKEEMTPPVTPPVTYPESVENVDMTSLETDKSPDAFINLDLPVNHINNHLISVSQAFTYIKGVPKKVNQVYAGKYGHQLQDFYARIQNAAKAVKRDTEIEIEKAQVHEIAYTSIVGLDKYVHEANQQGNPLSLGDMCRLIYQIAKNQFYELVNIKEQDYSPVYANQQEVIHNESETRTLAKPKHIIRKELVPDWLKAEEDQKESAQETEVTLEQKLEMIELKQDLRQELTPEEENLLLEHSSTYSLLEMAQLKQDLGQILTPEEQDCLRHHDQLKDTAS
ncbi:replication protein [Priestia megaterium]|uniref:Replication protein n=1 Tax=Priestia megaterium TaxID=1404 RepID=A0A3D8WZQ9_PRIMG|nr:replication protein [Priestia megaterium]MDH3168962.1 replication protein [Priestia megaterium]RDZ12651.1 replication protein [Priestia megaterium]